ncbi:SAG-related sequence [Besnoitia besnoiti]|uniref:SAG-related sequence n=1 Tax=Besnoitia besnoiti TaxID=94643 RepID=A0A2A9MDM3_BESBE|nr:SAG-related sequence [Besnoitia besnoiti]PFH36095.1 SAG-related sequence [Besnoitia besnoiti]
MVPVATARGSSAQTVILAMQERQGRKGRLPPRLRLPLLASIATIVIVSGFSSLYGVRAQQQQQQAVTPACSVTAPETACTCYEPTGTAGKSDRSAALSKEINLLKVKCGVGLQFAPTRGNKDMMVCSEQSTNLKDCDLNINDLLGGKSSDVKWEKCTENAREVEECKTLTIPQANLPFVDKSFAVGCTDKTTGEQKLCRIPVTIHARASETNGRTVTCAYGAGSNESRQVVTLNPSKNSFTLVCGEKGTVLPTNYDTKFCSSDPDGTNTTCDGDYQSILPGFENGWWKKEEPTSTNSFTLSIPVEKFPTEQAKMVVACQQTTPKPSSITVKDEKATSSVCRVDVTIEAGSPASFSVGSWQMSSLLAFVVTFVLARGM